MTDDPIERRRRRRQVNAWRLWVILGVGAGLLVALTGLAVVMAFAYSGPTAGNEGHAWFRETMAKYLVDKGVFERYAKRPMVGGHESYYGIGTSSGKQTEIRISREQTAKEAAEYASSSLQLNHGVPTLS